VVILLLTLCSRCKQALEKCASSTICKTLADSLPLRYLQDARGLATASLSPICNLQSAICNPHSPLPKIAQILANAVQKSRSLSDRRAEAHALLCLGNLYEQTKQFSEAKSLTQQGLSLAQTIITPEVAYRLEWQLGRLLREEKDFAGAIAAYDAAVETLKFLRNDLVTINPDIQFNFRDSVEPIYRQSVELLLQSLGGQPDTETLDKARERIEALQLAELDNFFQESCLSNYFAAATPSHCQITSKTPTALQYKYYRKESRRRCGQFEKPVGESY